MTALSALLLSSCLAPPVPDGPGALEVSVRANGVERRDHPVDISADFSGLPAGPLRVVELDPAGGVKDEDVPFQFDPGPSATLTLLMKGRTAADATRRYRITASGKREPPKPEVRVHTDAEDEGQESFKIVARGATYFYHKKGAGFSSLLDADGDDWLGFRPKGGSAGNYRGIPNLVHPEGYFHPGSTNCTTTLTARGPLKVTLESASQDGKWKCRWEIYPAFARLTVLKCDRPYWFLYEGTPGGELDLDADYCVRSDGRRTPASDKWTGDLPAPEWLYFGDSKSKRVLFLAHHEDDDLVDSYWPMQKNMTVFGFGRDGLKKHMDRTPNRFTIGLLPEADHETVMKSIRAAVHPLDVRPPR